MKKYLTMAVVLTVSVLLLSCDDDEDKMSGMDACLEASEQALDDIEDCLNAIGYTLGEDTEDMAEEFCEDECDDIDNKVESSKVDECLDTVGDMDCDELLDAFFYDDFDMEGCEWLQDDLGC